MKSSLLTSCDPINTVEEARLPVITPLLPIKGLRRDDKGELTEDAVKTILEGLKSLGIQVDTDATRDAVLQEARMCLCRLNSQIQFLLNMYGDDVGHSHIVDPVLMTVLKEKNQAMQDILSLSRQVIVMYPFKPVGNFIEKFVGTSANENSTTLNAIREEFEDVNSVVSSRQAMLNYTKTEELMERGMEDTEVQNTYASRQLELYSFMNVVAAGLLFYIYSAK
jgi:hypothetical protein